MGFGELYREIHESLGHTVTTVDTVKPATYADLADAVQDKYYDMAHVCVPNYLHYDIANTVAKNSKIVIVEKPGVKDAESWKKLLRLNPKTRFMMSKNNQWRDNIQEMRLVAAESVHIYIDWINRDRVPNPGSWFTDKSKAYGGVSRDLMPHLLSIYIKLNDDWLKSSVGFTSANQRWRLSDIKTSEYGTVDLNGVYDVDDHACMIFDNKWYLAANWRDGQVDNRGVHCYKSGSSKRFELGLCPQDAYARMIAAAFANIDNEDFWTEQASQDIWIHNMVQRLCQ